jgi:hypothetical protein
MLVIAPTELSGPLKVGAPGRRRFVGERDFVVHCPRHIEEGADAIGADDGSGGHRELEYYVARESSRKCVSRWPFYDFNPPLSGLQTIDCH